MTIRATSLFSRSARASSRDRWTNIDRRLGRPVNGSVSESSCVCSNTIELWMTQQDSLTDPLTGLPNRRSMFVHLSRELARAERLKSQVALIVMDIDGFKTIN